MVIDRKIIKKIAYNYFGLKGIGDYNGLEKNATPTDIEINGLEHCSQSKKIEEQFIIVLFNIVW